MKLKTWLLFSYFIVMVLPLIAAYLLFAWINSYNNDQKVTEFFDTSNQLQEIKTLLDDPELYNPTAEKSKVDQLANKQLSVVLYNQDGLVVYTSNPGTISAQSSLGKKRLYEGLYSLEQGFSTYNYKQPVFDERNLVGFFHVELARDEWVAGVSNRSLLTFGLFCVLFLLTYFMVIWQVDRKLSRRLTGLMDEMTSFAAGQTVNETPTNKDEIGKLTRHFYDMRKQIHSAREVIEQEQNKKEYMIATISHDLKTPLTSIKAYSESLENERVLTGVERREYLKIIVEKSDFMKQMLDDLLTYTLLQSPTYNMELVSVDGSEFFDMLVSGYEGLCKEKDIQLDTSTNVTGTYNVNPKQMMRVADNLMSNAIKHTHNQGKIWLTAISEEKLLPDWLFGFIKRNYTFNFDAYAYLIVQNEGEGISMDKLDRIFDPLYQADQARSKREAHGTGLGLSITKQIIDKHNGNARIFSKEGVGTCVICCFPRY